MFSFRTCTKLRILFDLGKLTSFNLLRILNFFYENYWSRLNSSSKCSGSVSHGDIKFWFSGNANKGRYCLLLKFHLSYYIRCIMNFKKIADASFNEHLRKNFNFHSNLRVKSSLMQNFAFYHQEIFCSWYKYHSSSVSVTSTVCHRFYGLISI